LGKSNTLLINNEGVSYCMVITSIDKSLPTPENIKKSLVFWYGSEMASQAIYVIPDMKWVVTHSGKYVIWPLAVFFDYLIDVKE